MPEKTCNNCLHNNVCNHDLYGFENCNNFISAADVVEVRHGEWIEDGDVVVCSECGEEHAWDEYRAIYCEDCGAKMDGKEQE